MRIKLDENIATSAFPHKRLGNLLPTPASNQAMSCQRELRVLLMISFATASAVFTQSCALSARRAGSMLTVVSARKKSRSCRMRT
jgi:hypothetical protein